MNTECPNSGLSKDLLCTISSLCQGVLGKELLHCSSPNTVSWSKYGGGDHEAHLASSLSFPLIHHHQATYSQAFFKYKFNKVRSPVQAAPNNYSLSRKTSHFLYNKTNEVWLPTNYLLMCEAFPAIVVGFFPPLIPQCLTPNELIPQLHFTQLNKYFHEILCFLGLLASCQTGLMSSKTTKTAGLQILISLGNS